MNEEELEKMLSDLESDFWNLKHNIAYINGEKYHGISRDLLGYIRNLEQENKELKEDLKFVLEQVLGAFVQNWCIDWNFNDIRKKYNISDKYDWNSDVDE